MANCTPRKIIIDTDPGVDDALAIYLAHHASGCELLGLTTVYGNGTVEITTRNALFLLEQFRSPNTPVIPGASRPLNGSEITPATFVHGEDGLGNIQPTTQLKPSPGYAADWLIEQIHQHPNEITLLPIAPLTNIAEALNKDPSIAEKVKEVVIMGGAVDVSGNINPAAEANIFGDPEAADIVFAANWPITLLPLDTTERFIFPEALLEKIHATKQPGSQVLLDCTHFIRHFYQTARHLPDITAHDVLTVAYCLWPECFSYREGAICVATDGLARGMTIQDKRLRWHRDGEHEWQNRRPVKVAIDLDAPTLLEHYFNTVTQSSPPQL